MRTFIGPLFLSHFSTHFQGFIPLGGNFLFDSEDRGVWKPWGTGLQLWGFLRWRYFLVLRDVRTLSIVTTQPLGRILEASKPLRQGQKTRILGRQSQSCSHLYSRLPAPSHLLRPWSTAFSSSPRSSSSVVFPGFLVLLMSCFIVVTQTGRSSCNPRSNRREAASGCFLSVCILNCLSECVDILFDCSEIFSFHGRREQIAICEILESTASSQPFDSIVDFIGVNSRDGEDSQLFKHVIVKLLRQPYSLEVFFQISYLRWSGEGRVLKNRSGGEDHLSEVLSRFAGLKWQSWQHLSAFRWLLLDYNVLRDKVKLGHHFDVRMRFFRSLFDFIKSQGVLRFFDLFLDKNGILNAWYLKYLWRILIRRSKWTNPCSKKKKKKERRSPMVGNDGSRRHPGQSTHLMNPKQITPSGSETWFCGRCCWIAQEMRVDINLLSGTKRVRSLCYFYHLGNWDTLCKQFF